MELLNPSCSPVSPSGSSSPASFPLGFDRSTTTQSPEIVEGNGSSKVHVAVGKSVEKSMSLLSWTFNHFEGKDVCLLHVYQPSLHIPTRLGKFPASQASPEVVANHRKYEREKSLELLQSYLTACSAGKVNVSIGMVEADQVERGIVDLVNKHGIRKLVMGAPPENCMKIKKSLSKANHAAKHVPFFCEIWFISKGKHLWTRYASETRGSAHVSPSMSAVDSPRPRSSRYTRNKLIHPHYSQSYPGTKAVHSETSNHEQCDPACAEVATSPALTSATKTCLHDLFGSFSTISSSTASGGIFMKRVMSADSDLNVNEKRLHGHVVIAKMEAEVSRNEAHADLLKLRKLRSEAMEAVYQIKKFDFSLKHEVKLRKEAEEALRTTLEDQENIMQEREGITKELRRTRTNIAELNTWVQEANRRHDETSRELKLVHESIAMLRQEKQEIWRQKKEAVCWLERWRSRGRGRSANCNSLVGFVEELSGLAEFSLSELQTATCNFSESFKIGQGGYGCVYKGEMLGRTVAIRKLHPHNNQGESEFQQEVKVLGKLKHPHLVSLLGVCPEAWSIIYEYLPNGSLQDNLARKNSELSWEVRVRIISDIASALCFLHSSKPEKVVHGNLTPQKILLDSTLRCKISDFGISRLIDEDNLDSPSMRWTAEPKAVFPYTDPEFPRVGILTSKSDVYSFGLIILQLLTRRAAMGLVGEVRKAVSFGNLKAVLDSSAGEWPVFVVTRLVDIALQCCELQSRERPDLTPSLVRELEELHASEERPVPSFFVCPILQEIMHDPQVAADGFTYEGEAIRGWLENGKDTSPMTNLRLPHLRLTPNHAIRLAIQDWLCNA